MLPRYKITYSEKERKLREKVELWNSCYFNYWDGDFQEYWSTKTRVWAIGNLALGIVAGSVMVGMYAYSTHLHGWLATKIFGMNTALWTAVVVPYFALCVVMCKSKLLNLPNEKFAPLTDKEMQEKIEELDKESGELQPSKMTFDELKEKMRELLKKHRELLNPYNLMNKIRNYKNITPMIWIPLVSYSTSATLALSYYCATLYAGAPLSSLALAGVGAATGSVIGIFNGATAPVWLSNFHVPHVLEVVTNAAVCALALVSAQYATTWLAGKLGAAVLLPEVACLAQVSFAMPLIAFSKLIIHEIYTFSIHVASEHMQLA